MSHGVGDKSSGPGGIVVKPRLVVVAGIAFRAGQVFLAQRPPGKHLAGCWEFPGGKLEPGEEPATALQRELQEELGVHADVGLLLDAVTHAYETFDLLMLLYHVRFHGEPQARDVAAVAWFPFTEAPHLKLPPADIPVMQRLESYQALLRRTGM